MLKDIKAEVLEALLDYVYVGEVNVLQGKLPALIDAAECLKIKGLAVLDEEPVVEEQPCEQQKRNAERSGETPEAKRTKINSQALDNLNKSRSENKVQLELEHDKINSNKDDEQNEVSNLIFIR